MPQPQFGPDDFENPDAPEAEHRLRPDHFLVRDLSYEVGRSRQEQDLWKGSLISEPVRPWDGYEDLEDLPVGAVPKPHLMLFVKERSRGPGYVCDFVYRSRDLQPVAVYGVLVNDGRGLMINELELWRGGWGQGTWGYWDEWDCFVGEEGWPDAEARHTDNDDEDAGRHHRFTGITTDVLRRIPLGEIVARAQAELADRSWETEGIRMLPGGQLEPEELPASTKAALETTVRLATPSRRGRPPLPDDLLRRVAQAYLHEAPNGRGLVRRLAARFDRPEATIKDWIATARERGFLSPATPGRRNAAPGPSLSRRPEGAAHDAQVDTSRTPMTRTERQSIMREMQGKHPELPPEAVELHIRAIEWSRTHGTEGFIPSAVAEALEQEIQASGLSRPNARSARPGR